MSAASLSLHPDRKQDLEKYLWGMEVIDFLIEHPSVKLTPEEFVGSLTKLQPRLYSVASSLRRFPTRYISLSMSSGTKVMGACEKASPRHFWPNARTSSRAGLSHDAKHFHSRKMATLQSSWSDPEQALRRSRVFQERQAPAQGKKLAFLRCATREMRLRLPGGIGRIHARGDSDTARLRLVA